MSEGYPPGNHLLRHLAVELEVVDDQRSLAHLEVGPRLLDAGTGDPPGVEVGALTTVVDVLAGSLVGRVVAPDWMATAELSLHLTRPVPPGVVVVDARVVRDGRTTVVVDASLRHRSGGVTGVSDADGPDGDEAVGETVGEAVLTFVRLPRRETTLDISAFRPVPGERTSFGRPDGPREAYAAIVGTRVDDGPAGRTTTEVTERVRNSFGALNGGVVAGLAAGAGRAAVGAAVGPATAVTDLAVHYLAQARTGPVTTTATVVRSGDAGGLARVEVVDGDGRRCVLAHVGVATTTPSGR